MARKAKRTVTESTGRTKKRTPTLEGREGTKQRKGRKTRAVAAAVAATESDLADDYGPDTRGEPLPEPDPRLTEEQQKAKDARYLARRFKAGPKQYAGPPIPATTVYVRQQPNRNTAADTWLLVNEVASTYTTVNTYRDVLPPSYQASTYTYSLTPAARRRVEKKIAGGLREVDAPDWPSWVTRAGGAAVEAPAASPVAKSRRKARVAEPGGGGRPGRGRRKRQKK